MFKFVSAAALTVAAVILALWFNATSAAAVQPLASQQPSGQLQTSASFYVAPDGADDGPGTLDAPFRTVQRCAEAAAAGERCLLRAGIYRETVTPANSGTAESPIVFEAYSGEAVTISGADPVEGWSLVEGEIYRAPVTLPVDGFRDSGFVANQVFVGGQMMIEARWPNAGLDLLRPNLGRRAAVATGPTTVRIESTCGDCEPIPNIPEGWAGATAWTNEWYVARTGTVTGWADGTLTAEMGMSWNRTQYFYFLTGKKSLLDSESEWFYDGDEDYLYLWSPGGGAPQNVEAKRRNLAFDLTERSFIEVRGLNIFASTIETSSASEGITLDRLDARYVSHHITLPPIPKAVQRGGFTGNRYISSHAHDTGIMLRGRGHRLTNSEVAFSAGNLVLLAGEGHTVENNIIHDGNYGASYAAPIKVADSGHRIVRNTIYNAGRSAIDVDWGTGGETLNNVEIAYNDIYKFGALSMDLGAIYTCCYIDMTGSRIHHNSIHNPYGFSYHWDVAGIYFDIESHNATVDHNLVWGMNTNKPKALKGGGKTKRGINQFYNNVFAAQAGYSEGAIIRNNLFLAQESLDEKADSELSNNLFSTTNLLLVDPENGDFRPRAESPAVDGGTAVDGITDGFAGSAPDVGAYEYGQPAWSVGANLDDLPATPAPTTVPSSTPASTAQPPSTPPPTTAPPATPTLPAEPAPTATPVPSADAALRYAYYEGDFRQLPNFDALDPVAEGEINAFSLGPRQRDDNFAFRFTGCVDVPTAGSYSFFTRSDDGTQLFVDGDLIVNNDGQHAARERSGQVALDAGRHAIEVTFFERRGKEVLGVQWSGPDVEKQSIPAAALSLDGCEPAAEPNAALVSGLLFVDRNGNGEQDENEPGLVGVLLTLSEIGSDARYTATTDADGYYQFTGIDAMGTYTITIALPPGYEMVNSSALQLAVNERGHLNAPALGVVDEPGGTIPNLDGSNDIFLPVVVGD